MDWHTIAERLAEPMKLKGVSHFRASVYFPTGVVTVQGYFEDPMVYRAARLAELQRAHHEIMALVDARL